MMATSLATGTTIGTYTFLTRNAVASTMASTMRVLVHGTILFKSVWVRILSDDKGQMMSRNLGKRRAEWGVRRGSREGEEERQQGRGGREAAGKGR